MHKEEKSVNEKSTLCEHETVKTEIAHRHYVFWCISLVEFQALENACIK